MKQTNIWPIYKLFTSRDVFHYKEDKFGASLKDTTATKCEMQLICDPNVLSTNKTWTQIFY